MPVEADYVGKLISELEKQHRRLTKQLLRKERLEGKIKQLFRQQFNLLETAPAFNCDEACLMEGLRETYSKGLKYLEVSIEKPDAENLHNLRKKVKLIWNQLCLLRPIWPPVLGPLIRQFDLLAEKLGQEHDLAELQASSIFNKNNFPLNDRQNRLKEFISLNREHILIAIIPLAKRLYAEKPGSLASKMEKYYTLYKGKPLETTLI
jgi:CHAD domain-containing protein